MTIKIFVVDSRKTWTLFIFYFSSSLRLSIFFFVYPRPFISVRTFTLMTFSNICQFQREQKSKKFCRNNQSTIVVIFEFLLDRNCTIYIFNHRGSLARTIAKSKFYALWIIPRPHPRRKTNLASSRLLNEKFNLEVNKPGLTNLG